MSDLIRFTSTRRTSRGELHSSWLSGGTLVIYDAGSGVPADSDVAITDQTVLVTFQLPSPAGTVIDGVLTADSIATTLIAASGAAAFARAYDSLDMAIGDYDVGTVGSNSAVELDNTNLVEGAYASVVSFTATEG
jgi:hypothetical protein